MKRISIRALMGVVLATAVAIAALRSADDYWAGGLFLITPLVLCVALIASVCGRARPRARRLGFAILGGGYFAVSLLGQSEANLAKLPTPWLLVYVHQKAAPPLSFGTFTVSMVGNMGTITGTSSTSPGFNVVTNSIPPVPPSRWARLLPGAANGEAFIVVGQCLFSLLAGLMGAGIAQWFRNRAEAERIAAAP